jgi:hypothetical protein
MCLPHETGGIDNVLERLGREHRVRAGVGDRPRLAAEIPSPWNRVAEAFLYLGDVDPDVLDVRAQQRPVRLCTATDVDESPS